MTTTQKFAKLAAAEKRLLLVAVAYWEWGRQPPDGPLPRIPPAVKRLALAAYAYGRAQARVKGIR